MIGGMRFGLPGGRGVLDARSPDSKLRQAEVADELGFDCLWFGEEHFSTTDAPARRSPSAPLVLAAATAARTARIRIGLSSLFLTLHNSVRLAEEIATLDALSGGRVNVGVGWPNARYVKAFGGEVTAPLLPARLDAMIGYWGGKPIEIEGVRHRVEPALSQRPHPPVYVAAPSDEAVVWTAERNYSLITPGVESPTSLRRRLDLFAAHGGRVADAPVERFCFVAESDALARRQALPLIEELVARQRRPGTIDRQSGITSDDDLEPERFYNESAIIGSPESVAARVAVLRNELGIRYVNLRPSLTGICPLALQRTTVELFAAEVIPRLTAPVQPAPPR
jgi:alkanesulfonate monooxygenase SsuD/methylene tetrahydromethanopterin reductase-like flavin-dependent oxidoreductase (luciferase family)